MGNYELNKIVKQICKHFSLGDFLGEIREISGGLLHQIWHIKTSKGEFAIKCIKEETINLLSHNLLSPQATQEVAAVMKQGGVPTVVGLAVANQYIFSAQNHSYLVMPWVEGYTLPLSRVNSNNLQLIGAILAKIHSVNFKPRNFRLPEWQGFSKAHWQRIIDAIIPSYSAIKNKMSYELPQLTHWSECARSVIDFHHQNIIFSHRDFDPKNVIWKNSLPILLDWEYAGYINRSLDIFIVALNWSDVLTGNIDKNKFQAVLCGYSTKMDEPFTFSQEVLFAYMGYCLDWLEFNIRNLSNENFFAEQEIARTLTAIYAVEASFSVLRAP